MVGLGYMSRSGESLSRRDFLRETLAAGTGLILSGMVGLGQEAEKPHPIKEELKKLEGLPGVGENLKIELTVEPKPDMPVIMVIEKGVDATTLLEHISLTGNSREVLTDDPRRLRQEPSMRKLLDKRDKRGKKILVLNPLSDLGKATGLRIRLRELIERESDTQAVKSLALRPLSERIKKVEKNFEKAREKLPQRLVDYATGSTDIRRDWYEATMDYFTKDGSKLSEEEKEQLARIAPPMLIPMIVDKEILDNYLLRQAAEKAGVGVVIVRKR